VSSPDETAVTARATHRGPRSLRRSRGLACLSPPSPSGSRPRSACCTTRVRAGRVSAPTGPGCRTVAALASVALAAVGFRRSVPSFAFGRLFAGCSGASRRSPGGRRSLRPRDSGRRRGAAFACAMGRQKPTSSFRFWRHRGLTFALAVGSLAATAGLVVPFRAADPPRSRGVTSSVRAEGDPVALGAGALSFGGVVARAPPRRTLPERAARRIRQIRRESAPTRRDRRVRRGRCRLPFRGGDARLAIGAVLPASRASPRRRGPRPPSVSARRSRCSTRRVLREGGRAGRTER